VDKNKSHRQGLANYQISFYNELGKNPVYEMY